MKGTTNNPFGPYFSRIELRAEQASEQELDKLLLLVTYILNPIREHFGPLIITSGYRTREYNASLADRGYHPSATSQHCLGEAVDFICHKTQMINIYEWVKANLQVGEMFYYKKKGHIHISLPNYELIRSQKADIRILDE